MKIIHTSAKIHPTAIIGDNVKICADVEIGPYCIIGYPPEWKGREHENRGVIIGQGTKVTGLVTIDAGADKTTTIGENCYLMKHSHIGHDVSIGNNCTISCGAKIGGHASIRQGTIVGLNAVVHQWVEIPSDCMIAMGAGIHKNTPMQPNSKYIGNPARIITRNK